MNGFGNLNPRKPPPHFPPNPPQNQSHVRLDTRTNYLPNSVYLEFLVDGSYYDIYCNPIRLWPSTFLLQDCGIWSLRWEPRSDFFSSPWIFDKTVCLEFSGVTTHLGQSGVSSNPCPVTVLGGNPIIRAFLYLGSMDTYNGLWNQPTVAVIFTVPSWWPLGTLQSHQMNLLSFRGRDSEAYLLENPK